MRIQKMALAALAVTGAGLTPSLAQAQSTNEIIETVGAMILADRLGIDPNLILMTQMNSGSSIFDLAPALTMGSYGQADPLQILAMQNMGLGWNDIARAGRVPDPIYSTLVRTRQLDSNSIWADELGSRYGASEQYLQDLHGAGYSWREIARATVQSQETGRSVEDILYENRLYANDRYSTPTSYRYYDDPVYVPPRRTVRYASVLPPPRRDWGFVAPALDSNRVVWVDNYWNSTERANRRPVYVRWSPQRVSRQPIYVRVDDDDNWRRRGKPIFLAQNNKHKTKHLLRGKGNAPRVIFVDSPDYYVVRRDTPNRFAFRDTSDRRAQRLWDDDDQRRIILARRQNAELRERERERQERLEDRRREQILALRERNDRVSDVREEQRRRAELLEHRRNQQIRDKRAAAHERAQDREQREHLQNQRERARRAEAQKRAELREHQRNEQLRDKRAAEQRRLREREQREQAQNQRERARRAELQQRAEQREQQRNQQLREKRADEQRQARQREQREQAQNQRERARRAELQQRAEQREQQRNQQLREKRAAEQRQVREREQREQQRNQQARELRQRAEQRRQAQTQRAREQRASQQERLEQRQKQAQLREHQQNARERQIRARQQDRRETTAVQRERKRRTKPGQ